MPSLLKSIICWAFWGVRECIEVAWEGAWEASLRTPAVYVDMSAILDFKVLRRVSMSEDLFFFFFLGLEGVRYFFLGEFGRGFWDFG